jgi:hypothetical protein
VEGALRRKKDKRKPAPAEAPLRVKIAYTYEDADGTRWVVPVEPLPGEDGPTPNSPATTWKAAAIPGVRDLLAQGQGNKQIEHALLGWWEKRVRNGHPVPDHERDSQMRKFRRWIAEARKQELDLKK